MSSPQAVRAMNEARRRHPKARVGDTFGARTVIELLTGVHNGRLDERVRWRCSCGAVGESFVHNMRANPRCRHRIASTARLPKYCACGGRMLYTFDFGRVFSCCAKCTPVVVVAPATPAVPVCQCDHSRDDHLPHGGACLDDDCPCTFFEEAPAASNA